MHAHRAGLTLLRRHWLYLVVSSLWILTLWVDPQALAQEPTPEVNTVPSLEDIYTRTPTPTPAPVAIVTATPAPGAMVDALRVRAK